MRGVIVSLRVLLANLSSQSDSWQTTTQIKDRIMRKYRSQNQARLNQNSPKRPLHNGAPAIHSGKTFGLRLAIIV